MAINDFCVLCHVHMTDGLNITYQVNIITSINVITQLHVTKLDKQMMQMT